MEAMDVKYKPAAYPNGGSVKKARQAPVVAAPVPPVVAGVRTYKECLKNHAAAIGAHAVDGCGEWMPLAELNPANVTSYKCAACGCHRNFHRQVMVEVEGSPPPLSLPPPPPPPQAALPPPQAAHPPPQAVLPPPPMVLHGMPQRAQEAPEDRLPAVDGDDDSDSDDSDGSDYDDDDRSISPPQLPLAHLPAPVAQHQPPPPAYITSAPHMLLSLNSSAPGAAPQGHRLPAQLSPATAPPPHGMMPARKRFRTKFTAEQKQRMQELSERLGWRLQKRDEGVVDEWCRDIGVSKGVFKVWMHNNKHNYLGGHSARRSASATAAASSAATTPTGPAGGGPFRLSPATGAPPPAPFNSATSHSSPAPTATGGFNMNGTASSASTVTATPVFAATAGRTANGATSPQSA